MGELKPSVTVEVIVVVTVSPASTSCEAGDALKANVGVSTVSETDAVSRVPPLAPVTLRV